jgi:hypothetical protein
LKTGSWGDYLKQKGIRMGSAEDFTMRSFIVCTVHPKYSGLLDAEDLVGQGI